MLGLGMFDGIFDRRDLDNLLTLLDGAADAYANLRPWGWTCTFTATITNLPVQVDILPPWTAGYLSIALTDEVRRDMRTQLDGLQAARIWLHAEGRVITLRPSAD